MAILILGVGQLVLPSLAAHVVRDRLDKYGKVLSVSVSAFPAVELLFGDADTVNVKMASYRAPESQVAKNIGQSSGVTNVNLSANTVTSGGVTIDDVTMTKRGKRFSGTGVVTEPALRAAIPLLKSVTPVASTNGELTVQGTSADFPIIGSVTADATVSARSGKVVVAFGGLIGTVLSGLTVWSNPRVYVESLGGKAANNAISLSATWRLG